MIHPQFLQICQIIKKYLPNINITIMTNGLNLHNFSDEELIYITKKCNINIDVSIYPTTIDIIKKQYNRFQNLKLKFGFQGARINFTKFTFNKEGVLNNQKQFNQCELRLRPEFTLNDNKIYSCCISPRLNLLDIPEQYNDYLDLKDFKNESQLYDLKLSPPNKCRFCGDKNSDDLDIIPWHSQTEFNNNHYINLKTAFINNYEFYHNIMDSLNHIHKAVQDSFFKEHIEEVFGIDSLNYLFHRINNNNIDIYIPITNHTNLNYNGTYYNNLLQQSIINKCNLYIVCLNTNKINEAIIYNTFTPYKNDNELFSYLYKANNLKEGYEKIKNEGYGKITYTLNLEDKRLENSKFLEEELKEYL